MKMYRLESAIPVKYFTPDLDSTLTERQAETIISRAAKCVDMLKASMADGVLNAPRQAVVDGGGAAVLERSERGTSRKDSSAGNADPAGNLVAGAQGESLNGRVGESTTGTT